MAKIKYYQSSGKLPKGTEIKSIVGENYKNNYKERLQKHSEIAKENLKTSIKAKDVFLD